MFVGAYLIFLYVAADFALAAVRGMDAAVIKGSDCSWNKALAMQSRAPLCPATFYLEDRSLVHGFSPFASGRT